MEARPAHPATELGPCGQTLGETVISRRYILGAAAALVILTGAVDGCSEQAKRQNSLSQNTGESGSTTPKGQSPYYPNTSGNIVAPPGNPGGNASGAPPIVGGTSTEQTVWPEGR